MGPDGHTASLFPGTRALNEQKAWVAANWVEKLSEYRITLTPPAINHATNIIFLVTGESKAERLPEVLGKVRDPQRLPSQLIQPVSGSLLWLVDKHAAQRLLTHPKMTPKKIAIGSDHAGFDAKEKAKDALSALGLEVIDKGTDSLDSVDYPDFGAAVARAVASGEVDRGVLNLRIGNRNIYCRQQDSRRACSFMLERRNGAVGSTAQRCQRSLLRRPVCRA